MDSQVGQDGGCNHGQCVSPGLSGWVGWRL